VEKAIGRQVYAANIFLSGFILVAYVKMGRFVVGERPA
jgi:hypothetical protein